MLVWKKISPLSLFILLIPLLLLVKKSSRKMEQMMTWPKSWDQLQAERKAKVAEVCAKYNEKTSLPINYGRFFYSPQKDLMMCSTAKGGSTTFFLTTFTQILEGEDYWAGEEPVGGFNFKIMLDRKVKAVNALKNQTLIRERIHHEDTITFTVVRHPFERLVSAYRHKTFEKNEGLGKLTFPEFLQQIVIKESSSCSSTNLSCMNLHWKPFLNNCSPCSLNYTVIVKVETFNEDRMGIHKMIGLPYKDTGHYHDLTKILNTTKSTEDWTKSLFENVSIETKQQLRDIYKYDFEMFEYDPFLY